eukprot:g4389.t1
MAVRGPVVFTNKDITSSPTGFGRCSPRTNRDNHWEPCTFNKSLNDVKDINLLFTVEDGNKQDTEMKERIQFFAEETIRNLVIEIRQREFFFMKQCWIFGHHKILELNDVKSCPVFDKQCLHVFTKLSNVKKLQVTTDKSTGNGLTPVKTLTTTMTTTVDIPIPSSMKKKQDSRLVLRGSVIEQGKDPLTSELECSDGDPIVHLIIRKSTKLQCYHLKDDGFEINVSTGTTVEEVKSKIEELTDGFQAHEHNVIKEGNTLLPGMSLSEIGIKKGDVLELVQVPLYLEEYTDPDSPSCGSVQTEMPLEWEKAKDALAHGVRPKLSSVGTGGSYFIPALEGKNLAVFKPQDEEPLAPNNPKGHRGDSINGDGLRRGVRPGEGAVREVIAFALDHEHFSCVPPTTMVSLSDMHGKKTHRKVGSFQQFVPHDMDCEEMGPSKFPVHEVHKICVLDIRLANADRNGGNILARQENGQWRLTPIDHGYCLPDSFEDINFEWIYWPQAKVPFNKATSEYISRLDAWNDLAILAKNGLCLRPECARVLLVCTMLLKKALVCGLTPRQIGLIMCRQTSKMSPLEKLHKQAMQFTLFKVYGESNLLARGKQLAANDTVYLETMGSLLDQYLEETQTV